MTPFEKMTNNFWFWGELRWAMESFRRSHRHKPSGYILWCKCPFTQENSYFLIINTQSWSSGHFGNKIAHFYAKVAKNHQEESSRMPTAIIFLSNEMQFSFDNFYTSSPACICLQICIHKAFCPILFYDFIRVYTLFYGAPCIHSYSSHPVTQSPSRLTLPDKTHMLE